MMMQQIEGKVGWAAPLQTQQGILWLVKVSSVDCCKVYVDEPDSVGSILTML